MKRVLAMLCTLALILSLGILPASAAGDALVLRYVTLRTTEGKEGLYFGATFTLTQATIDAMGEIGYYGVALTPHEIDDWGANMNGGKIQYSKYRGGLTADKPTYLRSTSLVNIINISNEPTVNEINANTTVYVKPYVCLADGTYIFGDCGAISMMDVIMGIDQIYDTLDRTQTKYLLGMYERFANTMKDWGLTNLKTDYKNGNPLILEYRREKVVANMQAQADIQWSFSGTEPITYSCATNSIGYRGMPYSLGSAGLQTYYGLGEQNNSGVWELGALNSSFFNGDAKADAYNVARLGNDCWDAISWAYESIGSGVAADQTVQCTPDYGMYPVGDYDFANHFQGAINVYGKHELGDTDNGYDTYYANNPENRQKMYEAYAQLQPGDALVRFTNIGGDSAMALSVHIVPDENGGIDPSKSTVTYMDQSSTRTVLQSRIGTDFDGTYTAEGALDHENDHANGGNPAKCEQCVTAAGYNKETGVWELNAGTYTKTLLQLFDQGHFIPMTSDALRNPTAKIAVSRLSDTGYNTQSVVNPYGGVLNATYRVSWVTLDVFDANGEMVNTVTAFGGQSCLDNGFRLDRLFKDSNPDGYGSVLKGTPKLQLKTATLPVLDENGNETYTYKAAADGAYYLDTETGEYVLITDETPAPEGAERYNEVAVTRTYTWLEAPDLPLGSYKYSLTCLLANGYTRNFRNSYFTVEEGTNILGESVHLVTFDGVVVMDFVNDTESENP